jgi:hypothetical protein
MLCVSRYLLVVIGELGMHGLNPMGWGSQTGNRVVGLRKAQENVCLSNEFKNTTAFARTAPFTVFGGTSFDGLSHYWGRADTIFRIGQSFGNSMISLLNRYKNN